MKILEKTFITHALPFWLFLTHLSVEKSVNLIYFDLSIVLSFQANLQDVPDRVPQLTVLDYGSRAANLSWVAPSDNQSPITRYTILYKPYTVDTWQDAGKETLYGSVTQAMLNGLQPNTIYTIKIRKGY